MSKGYRKKATIFKLIFDDPELNGLEVKCKSVSMGKLMEFVKLMEKKETNTLDEFEEICKMFSKVLVNWNLEDENGNSVPASYEGLMDQEPDFSMMLVLTWIDVMTNVSGPLVGNSLSGNKSLEASIPMEPLLESQAS